MLKLLFILIQESFKSVEWMEKMRSFGQISCVTLYAKHLLLIDR